MNIDKHRINILVWDPLLGSFRNWGPLQDRQQQQQLGTCGAQTLWIPVCIPVGQLQESPPQQVHPSLHPKGYRTEGVPTNNPPGRDGSEGL